MFIEDLTLQQFLDIFFEYVFKDCCSCPKDECVINGIDEIAPDFHKKINNTVAGECNRFNMKEMVTNMVNFKQKRRYSYITNDNSITDFYSKHPRLKCVDLITFGFVKFGLFSRYGGKFYLLKGYRQLSWRNIKMINNEYVSSFVSGTLRDEIASYFGVDSGSDAISMLFRYIFWYYRKAVVDSIAINILRKRKSVVGVSVGSTTITSDYDITLYGDDYADISDTIFQFNRTVKAIYRKSAEFVFDTNMYGGSFINLVHKDLPSSMQVSKFQHKFIQKPLTCNKVQFKYALPQTLTDDVTKHFDVKVTQHIWALMKIFTKLDEIQQLDDELYTVVKKELVKDVTSPAYTLLLKTAEKFQQKYEANHKKYAQIINSLQPSKKELTDAQFNSFISFVQYNGSETYYSRGAFLDVVVNQQMCKTSSEKINLSGDEYMDSFIENVAELMMHYHKEKYTNRAKHALHNILKLYKTKRSFYKVDKAYTKAKRVIADITRIQAQCNKKQLNNVVRCSVFMFMYNCIKLIRITAQSFLKKYDKSIQELHVSINTFDQFLQDELFQNEL